MWNDEFLSFYTDSVATFKQVILVQLHHPISLDPPTYHLLSHLCMNLLGRNAIALRLPALAGFLLFQLCLFFFVRRLAGDRSAIIAMAFPLLTASFRYSVEGRPYGLLLGLYALALLCWQIATVDNVIPRSRILPLTGLALSIALAITSHYFGVLILIPVSLGELSRTLIRKRLDLGVLTALILGLASVALLLPFQHALMVYRQHYYITGVNIRNISQGYRELFLRYTTWPMSLQKLAAALMVVLALTLAYAGYQRFKRRPSTEHAYTWVALVSMALLPFFGYLFGRFVTHTMEVRYVIAALIAFAATFGIVLERKLRSNAFYYSALTLITAAAIAINTHNILQERRASLAILASLHPSPALASALAANPTRSALRAESRQFLRRLLLHPRSRSPRPHHPHLQRSTRNLFPQARHLLHRRNQSPALHFAACRQLRSGDHKTRSTALHPMAGRLELDRQSCRRRARNRHPSRSFVWWSGALPSVAVGPHSSQGQTLTKYEAIYGSHRNATSP